MAESTSNGNGGILDLERELTCSICTDVLYQPLTLLDCLHTFCGSCLKEWFSFQAASVQQCRRRVAHPYTCPSCRAPVRATRPNASVTSLLDVFLKIHPGKGKSNPEKGEIAKHYKPSDDVIPQITYISEEDDSDDERVLQQVMDMSLTGADPSTARRARRSDRPRRRHQSGSRGPNDQQISQQPSGSVNRSQSRHNGQVHTVEHQPSLRSLLSASEVDSQEVQEEIMRSIIADGVLENIDLDNLTAEQEEELTERIAQAYRRRQRQRNRSRNGSRRREEHSHPSLPLENQSGSNPNAGSTSASNPTAQARFRPPISRPHLFQQTSAERLRTRSRSSHSRRREGSRSGSSHSHRRGTSTSGSVPSQAIRSATDLPERPGLQHSEPERRRRPSSNARSANSPENATTRSRLSGERASSSSERANIASPEQYPSETARAQSQTHDSSGPSSRPLASSSQNASDQAVRPMQFNSAFAPELAPSTMRSAPSHSTFAPELVQPPPFEPSVTCRRCGKSELQYDIHYHCGLCADGSFDLCFRCYRYGKGCDHWFGFGYASYARWHRLAESQGYPPSFAPPHILSARQYLKRPSSPLPYPENPGKVDSEAAQSRPEGRLKEGAFCERCHVFSNACFWHCATCLEGAWGFCNNCVQAGKHCTHPLIAMAHKNTIPNLPQEASKVQYASPPQFDQQAFVFLPISTDCDLCNRTIAPNNTRFHCYECSSGNYDICQDCYGGLEALGKIFSSDGANGWRKCPQGHRMALVGFQDVPTGGQQRLTVRAPAGGWALKEEAVMQGVVPGTQDANRGPAIPPDGGVGMHCVGRWSYWPEVENEDELAFPRGAEVREVEDINGEWYWGVYAGDKGVFPGSYVRIMRS